MATHSKPSERTPSVVIETLGAKTSETKDGLRKINNYLLKKEIGHGAFGTVHLGVNTLTNEEYAIKEFSKSRLRRKEQMAMMRRGRGRGRGGIAAANRDHGLSNSPLDLVRSEVAILKKLNHRNVIKLYEVLDDPDGDSLYMVLEMAHKGVIMQIDLHQVATPYTESTSRYHFRQIILGIEYLHCNDIVHRDIKPDNLLLSDNSILKIVDFGVSEMFVKGDDALKSTAGSPAFMPPELCTAERGGPVSGKAADIWSMGVTLYCLVHGRVPFSNESLLGLHEMILNDPIQYSKNLSKDLVDLLQKLMEKDPSKRILMQDIRNHAWVTNNGQEPMVSEEDNCHSILSEITEEDIRGAITSVRHIFTVMQAVAKFKRHSRSLSANSVGSMMNSDVQKPPTKTQKIDNLLSIPNDQHTQVINVVPSDTSVHQIHPVVVERRCSRSESPPAGMSSTISSTFSSHSSVHTPY
ncbi:uncharacterized protein ATC70_006438 [Mucor velutinosus]|uniref:Protein kinase domain-containing protein n=1 Tax=Mucor velutinosus TaxID=708070 RepID=A0AAN7DNE7_9FUNG|nr:hypothetical protein ATC70_006438 [Mucor velutinosus]